MHTVLSKHLLSPNNGVNIYRGCSHGCIYCDSRSKCYQMNHEFTDIEVKINAIDLLKNELSKKKKKIMISTGSMSDPYMHIEKELKLTHQMLEVINDTKNGVVIQTKSAEVLNDLELLKKISIHSKTVVGMTLTTYNDNLCRIIEPFVSTTSERFMALKKLHENGIITGVWLCPFLPFINDTKENILGLLSYCKEAHVKYIICFGVGLTLREGNREYFYKKLDEHFPGIKNKYIKYYGNNYEINSFNKELYYLIINFCKENNIMYNINEIFTYLSTYEDNNQLTLF